jgi:hypothetical protein
MKGELMRLKDLYAKMETEELVKIFVPDFFAGNHGNVAGNICPIGSVIVFI